MSEKNDTNLKHLVASFQHQLNRLTVNLETLASRHPDLAHLQNVETRSEQAPEVERLLHGTAMLMADVALSIDEHLLQAGVRLLAMKNPDLAFWCPRTKVTAWPQLFKRHATLAMGTPLQIEDEGFKEKTFSASWSFHRQGVEILSCKLQAHHSNQTHHAQSTTQIATHQLLLKLTLDKSQTRGVAFCCYIQGLSLFAWELWEGIALAYEANQKYVNENENVCPSAVPSGLGSATHRLLWPRKTQTPWGGALLEDFFNSPESLRFFEFTLPTDCSKGQVSTLSVPLILRNECQLLKLDQSELLAMLLPDPVLYSNVFIKALKPLLIESDASVHHIEPQGAYKAQQRIMRIEEISQEHPQASLRQAPQSLVFHHEETWHQSPTHYGAFLMLHQTLPIGSKLSMNALCTETQAHTREHQAIKAFKLLQVQSHTLASLCKLDLAQFVELMLTFDHTEQNTWSHLPGAFVSLKVETQRRLIKERACFTPMSAHRFCITVLPEKMSPIPVAALGYVLERWLAGFCSSFEMVATQITHASDTARVLYEGSWKISPTQNVSCSALGPNARYRSSVGEAHYQITTARP